MRRQIRRNFHAPGWPGRDAQAIERSGIWLAWLLWGCSLLLLLLGVGTLLMVERADPYYQWPLLVVNGPVFATVGAVIVAKRPAHPIGWLLAGIGLRCF